MPTRQQIEAQRDQLLNIFGPPMPTSEQVLALKQYAYDNGRCWKAKLLNDWMTGHCSGELQQLRNALGPQWLMKYKLPH